MLMNKETLIADIEAIIIPLSFDGLDEEKHHCEYSIACDRKRILDKIKEYLGDR